MIIGFDNVFVEDDPLWGLFARFDGSTVRERRSPQFAQRLSKATTATATAAPFLGRRLVVKQACRRRRPGSRKNHHRRLLRWTRARDKGVRLRPRRFEQEEEDEDSKSPRCRDWGGAGAKTTPRRVG